MAIKDLMNYPGENSWFDQLWLTTVEDNLSYLMTVNNVQALNVDPIAHEHFKHNFHGYLRENVTEQRKYWYVIMRCNNMRSPLEFDDKFDYIIWPKLDVIDRLHDIYLASLPNTN
ncbi:hypothetical protein OGA59_004526 [Salmonella enterica]|uniref:Uncharacterized protein n=1 Tax=Salmonella muenchen TaxID=596 RepID=A0A5U8Y2A9_SALMU|nr:hypothetical protein [Salmonella enterica subsp. enterica serovar Muenchen]EGO2129165.1 hypothetical protein [Salmonella enterica]EJY3320401.1 hypothetical protein [Salmonella enterica]